MALWIRIRIRIELNCWIYIRIWIESICIHNPGKKVKVKTTFIIMAKNVCTKMHFFFIFIPPGSGSGFRIQDPDSKSTKSLNPDPIRILNELFPPSNELFSPSDPDSQP
jgi:hypothetical protein